MALFSHWSFGFKCVQYNSTQQFAFMHIQRILSLYTKL